MEKSKSVIFNATPLEFCRIANAVAGLQRAAVMAWASGHTYVRVDMMGLTGSVYITTRRHENQYQIYLGRGTVESVISKLDAATRDIDATAGGLQ